VIPLYLDAVSRDGPANTYAFISAFRLNTFHSFVGMFDGTIKVTDLCSAGPYLLVRLVNFIGNFHFLTPAHLQAVGDAHHFGWYSHCSKATIMNHLMSHNDDLTCRVRDAAILTSLQKDHIHFKFPGTSYIRPYVGLLTGTRSPRCCVPWLSLLAVTRSPP
jgi:hypothetical protein